MVPVMAQPVEKSRPVSEKETHAGPNAQLCQGSSRIGGAQGCLLGPVAGSQGVFQQVAMPLWGTTTRRKRSSQRDRKGLFSDQAGPLSEPSHLSG
ncbi:MAG: hypothetical protein K0Q71_4205 [Thermomicrobiales bacterium]|nr:hypothetical protein [Thermomicrobiales bacterium]